MSESNQYKLNVRSSMLLSEGVSAISIHEIPASVDPLVPIQSLPQMCKILTESNQCMQQ